MKTNPSFLLVSALVLALLCIAPQSNAKTLTVDDNAPADYSAIQPAIQAAVAGDTIVVRDGVYTGAQNRGLDFAGKAITLRSENGPEACVIDCELAARAFYFHSGETASARLEGLTIRNGRDTVDGGGIYCINASPTIIRCVLSNNQAGRYGAGMYIQSGNPTLEQCRFETNAAQYGGGIFTNTASPNITDCIFTGNTAVYNGGGIHVWTGSNPTLQRCRILNNTAGQNGGGIHISGADSTVLDCEVFQNQGVTGGGISIHGDSQPSISRCIIRGNTATNGGGLYTVMNTTSLYSAPIISSCLIVNNYASGKGGALWTYYCTPIFTNCTITGNVADGGNGAFFNEPFLFLIYYLYQNPVITNCILWDNTPTANPTQATITYSDVQGGFTGTGNLNADPKFGNALYGEYHLMAGSPCFNVGNNAASGIPAQDRDGKPRILGAAVDLGAYESGPRTLLVPQQYSTIQAAIEAALAGDTVLVADGVYSGPVYFRERPITVRSLNGPENCIIDGSWTNGFFVYLYNLNSSAVLQGFTIRGGRENWDAFEAPIMCSSGSPIIRDCIIRDNISSSGPSAIYCSYGGTPTIANCTLMGNIGYSAAILCRNTAATITNCTIVDNVAYSGGGVTGSVGGGIASINCSPVITNTILWGNSTQVKVYGSPAPVVTYSNVQGGYSGAGNLNADPMFADALNDDYRLTELSGCRDFGNNAANLLPTDQDGQPRQRDGHIDLGAFEFTKIRRVPQDFSEIQPAIDAAASGDTILVADGEYPGNLKLNGKAISLRSENGPQNCIIKGTSTDSAVIFESAETAATELEGFTISGGLAGGAGGGIVCDNEASPTIRNCIVKSNQAEYGGGVAGLNSARPNLINCLVFGNVAGQFGGGIFCDSYSTIILTHCTVVNNTANTPESGGGIYLVSDGQAIVINSILRGNVPEQIRNEGSVYYLSVSFSNIEGGCATCMGYANLDADALFAAPEEGDYHLQVNSPCIGTGRVDGYGLPPFDLEGRSRNTEGAADMGAYEFGHETWNVPAQIPTIQEAIDKACYGDTIVVAPGTYPGGLDFKGKAITVQAKPGTAECIIDCGGAGPGVAFFRGEKATSVLSGFTILNANGTDGGAIFCMNTSPTIVNCVLRNNAAQRGAGIFSLDASPVVTHCTIVANSASVAGGGIYSNGSPSPVVTNCILWGNTSKQVLFEGDAPVITYSDVQSGFTGTGNINSNPRFVNAAANDYHLTNEQTIEMIISPRQWYLSPKSPCVDTAYDTPAGMPAIDKDNQDRIYRAHADMGAYEVQGSRYTYQPGSGDLGIAISLAVNGDTIWVPDGTHSGNLNFMGKAITVKSLNGPAGCIIRGWSRGAVFQNGEGNNSVLSGFTIQGFTNWQQDGGAIYCSGTSPTIENCVLQSNGGFASRGGGIFCGSGAAPLIRNCQILGNVSGVFSLDSSPFLSHCTISSNSRSGITIFGSGTTTVVNCLIVGNTGSDDDDGGGITVGDGMGKGGSLVAVNCTITKNASTFEGGGVCTQSSTGQWALFNCLIWGNSARYAYGADVRSWSGYTSAYNCIISGADPKFFNPAAGDYSLQEGSPCFDAGQNHSLLTNVDLAGKPRIQCAAVDIGAYELQYRPVVFGQLKVAITPDPAVQEGAQWQLGDGQWHNPDETVSGLTAGYYSVTFKPLPGWIDPATLTVWVSGDTLATAATEYKSTHFALGQIPAMQVRQGQPLDFQIRADGLSGPITYSYQIQNQPTGSLSLDPANGRFLYTPSAQDREPFPITLIATNGQKTVFQTMEITPIVDLPGEYDMFDEPTQPLPDPQSNDYIFKEEFVSSQPEVFNTISRTTRMINILGKEVVIQSGHANNLYLYDNNPDIKAMTIYADKLIVRNPFRLPQTNLTIYARDIRFEGATACVDTTPLSLTTEPPTIGAAGTAGVKAGSITLHAESVFSEGNRSGRFILQGGNGQKPGKSRNGANGISVTRALLATDCATWIPWPPLIQVVNGDAGMAVMCQAPGFPGFAAMTGGNATAAGKPGSPGDGGNVYANLDPRVFVNNPGGLAQPSTPAALHAQYDAKGGAAGQPYPSYFSVCHPSSNTWDPEIHHGPGADAPAPEPDRWVGNPGQFHRVGDSLSWLHPHAVKMVVAYAKDAYLNKYDAQAKAIFESYLTPLNQYIGSTMWSSVDADQQQELEQLRDEILTYVHQIESGLDFFGNLPGWAPMLSFEVTQQVYEREVDRSIQVLYLSYWLGKVMGDAAKETLALETARVTLKGQIDDYKAQYTSAVNLIPSLKTESEEIAAGVASLQQQLREKEQQLLAAAEQNIKDRNKVPWWKTALRVLGSVATTAPRATSVTSGLIMGAGAAWSAISEDLLSDNAWPTIINKTDISKQFNSIDFDAAVNNWMTDSGVTITGKSEADLEGYLNNLRDSASEIASNMTAIKDTLKETNVNDEEVGAELMKLKQQDPQFNTLIDDTVELMARKEVFAQQMASTMRQVSGLSNDIRHNLISIDALNRRNGEVAVVVDQRAKLYLKEMDSRARKRLLKYHYYMSKAYEYRLLEPYPGQLNLQPLFDRFVTIGSGNGRLTSSDFLTLRPLLTDQLSTIADDILERYLDSRGGGELGTSFTFDLTAEEIQKLNTAGKITVNLYERGLFLPSEEDIRIVNLGVESLTPQNPQSGCGVSYIKVYLEHSGLSRLMKNGRTYLFRHFRRDSSEDPSINKSVWGSTFDHNNGNLIDPIQPSAASESLLRSVLGIGSQNLMIYSRPSAWSDLVVRIEKNPGSCEDILIGTVKLRVRYDWSTRSSSQVVVGVDTSQSDLLPYYIIDTADLNGRQDGVGELVRTYQKSSYGSKKVTITAPETVGGWQFVKWTRKNGLDLPSAFYTANPLQIKVPLDNSYSVRAQYQFVGNLVRYGDGDADQDIDLNDFGLISASWMKMVNGGCSGCERVDFNNDGLIDLQDLEILIFHWMQ